MSNDEWRKEWTELLDKIEAKIDRLLEIVERANQRPTFEMLADAREHIALSEKSYERVQALLENPPAPNDKLVEAAKAIPNAATQEAIAELEAGEGARFEFVEDLMADLNDDGSPTWSIVISTADAEKGCEESREITTQVQAPTGKDALIKAISQVELRDGEMFHDVHIGPSYDPTETYHGEISGKGVALTFVGRTFDELKIALADTIADYEEWRGKDA